MVARAFHIPFVVRSIPGWRIAFYNLTIIFYFFQMFIVRIQNFYNVLLVPILEKSLLSLLEQSRSNSFAKNRIHPLAQMTPNENYKNRHKLFQLESLPLTIESGLRLHTT